MKNKYLSLATAVGLAASLLVALPAFAQTGVGVGANVNGYGGIHNGANGGMRMGGMHGGMMGVMPGIFGTVSTVSGDTLTVTAGPWPGMMNATSSGNSGATTYTVDASNAKVYKGSATSTVAVSAIDVGDVIMVQGTVSGTNVTATVIRDGVMGIFMGGRRPGGMGGGFGHSSSTPASSTWTPPASPIQGNGEPVIGGSVTAISGTTLTVTNPGNVTYTIDVSSATIVKNGTTTTVASIATGDNLIVQGTVNGTSITASSVIDQGMKASATSTGGAPHGKGLGFGGFFGAIGGFFQRLFKF